MADYQEHLQGLKDRTKKFSLRIIKLYSSLPNTVVAKVIGKQILRSGTSVGAQFREGCRAKSDADLINKLHGSLQELEETQYWLELLADSEMIKPERLTDLSKEADELIAIFVSIVVKLKAKT